MSDKKIQSVELSQYDFDSLRQADKDEIIKDYSLDSVYEISKEEYIVYKRISKQHLKCLRTKDGLSKFGAIGGGHIIKFHIVNGNPDLSSALFRCQGCETTYNLTEMSKNESDLSKDALEGYEKHSKYSLNYTEYYRLKKFIELYAKDKTYDISFIGTGLGNLITVRTENGDTEYVSEITDISNW